jgi:hypothetical protein
MPSPPRFAREISIRNAAASHPATGSKGEPAPARIGDSPAAPLLTLIEGPSEETHRIRETKKEFGERHEIRLR